MVASIARRRAAGAVDQDVTARSVDGRFHKEADALGTTLSDVAARTVSASDELRRALTHRGHRRRELFVVPAPAMATPSRLL